MLVHCFFMSGNIPFSSGHPQHKLYLNLLPFLSNDHFSSHALETTWLFFSAVHLRIFILQFSYFSGQDISRQNICTVVLSCPISLYISIYISFISEPCSDIFLSFLPFPSPDRFFVFMSASFSSDIFFPFSLLPGRIFPFLLPSSSLCIYIYIYSVLLPLS
jgi:hypothetical protein